MEQKGKTNEFAFSHIEDLSVKITDENLSFGFQIFSSYLKLASLFHLVDKNMWMPTDMIYEDINGQKNLDEGLDENTPDEELHKNVHTYVNAYVEKGIFEKKKLDGKFKGEFKCDEMVCMVNPTDVETLTRFVDIVSISWGTKAKVNPKKDVKTRPNTRLK